MYLNTIKGLLQRSEWERRVVGNHCGESYKRGRNMKNIMQNKTLGFWVTLIATGVSLITSIVYLMIYSNSRYMSWESFGIMLAGVALTIVFILLKQYRFAPSVLLVTDFLSLLFYVYYIYFYISSVVTGIQFSGFPLSFFINIVLYAISLVLSIACVFMRQTVDEGGVKDEI